MPVLVVMARLRSRAAGQQTERKYTRTCRKAGSSDRRSVFWFVSWGIAAYASVLAPERLLGENVDLSLSNNLLKALKRLHTHHVLTGKGIQ